MHRSEVITSIVLSAQSLGRIAAQETGNDAPAAQWRVLGILMREGGFRVGELAAAARITQPGMTRLIGDLERAGLVVRSRDSADSRVTRVDITDAGRAAIHSWGGDFRTALAPRFADLSEADWDALTRAAEILATRSI